MDIKDIESFWNSLPSYDKLTFEESVALTEMIDNLISECITIRAHVSALGQAIGETVVAVGIANDMPMTGPELLLMLKSVPQLVSALQTEAKHWKDQHANEVKRARILKDTTDLPLERVRAYELMGELQGQVEMQKVEIARLNGLLYGGRCVYCGEVVGSDTLNQDLSDDVLKQHVQTCPSHPYVQMKAERDQLRAEVEELKTSLGNQCNAVETSYEKGAESMRERIDELALEVAHEDGYIDTLDFLKQLRALPLKETP